MWKCKCGETNPDSSSFCQSCGNRKAGGADNSAQILKRQQEQRAIEIEKQKIERIQQERTRKVDNLVKMGFEGYYEYKVISLVDDSEGGIYSTTIESTLNNLGLDGWHLRCAYTNELGKNSNSSGVGGFSTGTNATVDENILIFERFIRINKG